MPAVYTDVRALSYQSLCQLCKKHNISTQRCGRETLEILLCEVLGISTTGTGSRSVTLKTAKPKVESHCFDEKEMAEYEALTPSYVQSIDSWASEAKDLPAIDVGMVKPYLLNRGNSEFTLETLKKYKLTRSYQHVTAKNVHSVCIHKTTTFCLVKAQCLLSQSSENKRMKWLFVVLDKMTGEPYGAFCTCTVGYVMVQKSCKCFSCAFRQEFSDNIMGPNLT